MNFEISFIGFGEEIVKECLDIILKSCPNSTHVKLALKPHSLKGSSELND
jgi:hypothetical protein